MEKHYKLQNGTELHIFTNDESSFMVTATLIIKNGKALLVGSGFKQSEGERIVRYLQDAQLTLEKIFIIQGDPDYYFALEPIKKSFPEVIVYATSYVIDHILKTVSKKLQVWGDSLGDQAPKNIILPALFQESTLEFEGDKWEFFGSEPSQINLWNAETKTIIGGINTFNQIHLFLADSQTTEKLKAWQDRLKDMKALDASLIIPGHADSEGSFDSQALDFSIAYIEVAIKLKKEVKDSATFVAKMKEKFPNLRNEAVLELSAKVLTGEIPWG
ncbi:TPA: cytoplasmic protein [Streptococcus suis]|nr:cytoplasmic protein [Streptococcus suis]HEM5490323.1 cytoplasmic protein [Streptococcus suis]